MANYTDLKRKLSKGKFTTLFGHIQGNFNC